MSKNPPDKLYIVESKSQPSKMWLFYLLNHFAPCNISDWQHIFYCYSGCHCDIWLGGWLSYKNKKDMESIHEPNRAQNGHKWVADPWPEERGSLMLDAQFFWNLGVFFVIWGKIGGGGGVAQIKILTFSWLCLYSRPKVFSWQFSFFI